MSGVIDHIDGKELYKNAKGLLAMIDKLDQNDTMKKFAADFEASSKDFKENKKNNKKIAGKNVYGAL